MAKIILQRIYDGSALSSPTSGVMYFRMETAGTVTGIDIYTRDGSPNTDGDSEFTLRLRRAGSALDSIPLVIPQSDGTVHDDGSGLDAVEKGDEIVLDLDDANGGTITSPVTLLLEVDDGIDSGAGRFENFVPLIVFNGESNSGGLADNADATTDELAPRSVVQILNNTTLLFEDLDIGTNNLIDHDGLTDNASHGWELGLANTVADGDWQETQVYLVKTGQGGSVIADWADDGDYWAKFLERIDAALTILREAGKIPVVYLWYSQGINDAVASTPVNDWVTATLAHFEKMRDKLGFCPILITELMSDYDDFNVGIDTLVTASNFNFKIETSDATIGITNHWDYDGMKLISGRMKDVCIGPATGEQPYYGANQSTALYRLFRDLGGDTPDDHDTFFDDFNDNSFDTGKWSKTESGATITETSNQLQVAYSGSSGNSFIESVNAYDFTGKRVSAEFVTPKMNTSDVDQELLLAPSSALSSFWMISMTNGNVRCFVNSSLVHTETYDSVAHHFGQMRFTGSNVVFEVSADGTNWNVIYTQANSGDISALEVFLRSFVSTSQTFTAKWDNFRSNV